MDPLFYLLYNLQKINTREFLMSLIFSLLSWQEQLQLPC